MDPWLTAAQECGPPDMQVFNAFQQDRWSLLLIALLCGVSILLIVLWLLLVRQHLHRARKHPLAD
jgi:hypothetical protein